MKRQDATRDPRGWGPFSGRQLTTVIVALVVGVLGYPFAAGAASAVFTSASNATPALKATNTASAGIGVQGTGKQYGVLSNGPPGIAAGKPLLCSGCVLGGDLRAASIGSSQLQGGSVGAAQLQAGSVGIAALAPSARTNCSGYPHSGIDWSIPGSTPGHGCELFAANLTGAELSNANLMNADLQFAKLGPDLSSIDLVGANLSNAQMLGVNLTNATLTGATLHLAVLSNANLTNADLNGADLSNANDTNVTWANTTCPDGTNSNNDTNTCSGHGAP
jgi:uncharacterized protein YjbI with pentapeptide repeats